MSIQVSSRTPPRKTNGGNKFYRFFTVTAGSFKEVGVEIIDRSIRLPVVKGKSVRCIVYDYWFRELHSAETLSAFLSDLKNNKNCKLITFPDHQFNLEEDGACSYIVDWDKPVGPAKLGFGSLKPRH
jgi:hypothetical protein